MIETKEILNFLKQNKTYFQNNFNYSKIGLFGSYARNEQTENSDIDIIIVYKPKTENLLDKELEIKQLISQKFNKKVDICYEKWLKPIFKPLVLKETIYA